ncbi:MAG TPA: LysE family translocator [Thermopetrobacter sp.]|nr:LysE family translocator [Thermopetrobacter sp.]
MFDYAPLHWMAFFTASVLIVIAPGPDFAFVLSQTVRGGRRGGFAAMFGVLTGGLGHALLAALGLSAILLASATIFMVLKVIGAAYLIWLGIQALRGGDDTLTHAAAAPPPPLKRIYRQGALVCLFNPKAAAFFLAFLPQFVVNGAGPVWAQMLLHGLLVVAVAALLLPLLVLAGDRLAETLRATPRIGRWLQRALGGALIGLGLSLALQER